MDDYQGKNEVINGIEIQTHALMSPSNTSKKKQLSLVTKAEETKVNFFNPNLDDDRLSQDEEHQIIENKVDPLEWNKEVEAVYRDLVKIEQEIEIMKKQGSASSSDFEEFQRHLELIIEMCNDIKTSSHHEVRKVFEKSASNLEENLQYIRKNEIRINRLNEKAITELGQITQKKKKLATELRALINLVKEYDHENRELQSTIKQLQNSYDEKTEDLGG